MRGNIYSKFVKADDKRAMSGRTAAVTTTIYSEETGSFVGAGALRKYKVNFTTQTTIVVTHNLNCRPLVQLNFDNGGGTFSSDKHILYNVTFSTLNQLTINLGLAATGEVVCIG